MKLTATDGGKALQKGVSLTCTINYSRNACQMIAIFITLLFITDVVDGDYNDTNDDNITWPIPEEIAYSTTGPVQLSSTTIAITKSSKSATDFQPDCSDPHNKQITCSVHVGELTFFFHRYFSRFRTNSRFLQFLLYFFYNFS
ncbi:unnamed protein product [Haemonchus placei]|uniref:Uncharacterized protein n=1 Tax=Haemonchus placei TaxID=6290 RepID=A0A3P7WNV3_HAEPC|nr:unnamed protein product [Haemonchus placei]